VPGSYHRRAMSLDELTSALPDHARDLRLNLASVIDRSPLTTRRLWGSVLACAIAVRSPAVLRALAPEARARLTPEAYEAVRATASVMALSNVFFRTRHLLADPEYGALRPGLRTTVPAFPGVDRTDIELWSVAVSAVNGCGACLDAHERVLREAGVGREVIQEAFKVASVIQALATTLEAEADLAP
jgi:alkyl hydroperoxide reductase subunit D